MPQVVSESCALKKGEHNRVWESNHYGVHLPLLYTSIAPLCSDASGSSGTPQCSTATRRSPAMRPPTRRSLGSGKPTPKYCTPPNKALVLALKSRTNSTSWGNGIAGKRDLQYPPSLNRRSRTVVLNRRSQHSQPSRNTPHCHLSNRWVQTCNSRIRSVCRSVPPSPPPAAISLSLNKSEVSPQKKST